MKVGVNYPWDDYGFDFGRAPDGTRAGNDPAWLTRIEQDLAHFRALGISVVRWFILADGVAYGIGADAPHPSGKPNQVEWRFDPPAMDSELVAHFAQLLEEFARVNGTEQKKTPSAAPILLMPVFIDYLFCMPGNYVRYVEDPVQKQTRPDTDWVKQGRSDAITDAAKRKVFLERALTPLLRAAEKRKDTIFAWDIINEPEWVTTGWDPNRRSAQHVVTAEAMIAFIQEARTLVQRQGFKATVGFRSVDTIRRTKIFVDFNQFHHYPGGVTKLEKQSFDPKFPGIIGEFATSTNDVWPELKDRGQSVLNRLKLADRLGYPLAMAWSFRQKDPATAWSSQVEVDIECFTQGRNCPGG